MAGRRYFHLVGTAASLEQYELRHAHTGPVAGLSPPALELPSIAHMELLVAPVVGRDGKKHLAGQLVGSR